ncbi:MAG: hypothetical protein PHH08_03080 [Candidatus ainarchaeum sp.]|nr:hypothetical protein [Candidatus ainarchaeum sp.]
MNQKGQEEAPFELLIAVIVMGFVLFIGLRAMTELQDQRCAQQAESKLEELKTKIEIVINQKSPQTIDFRSDCYNPKDEIIKVTYSERASVCAEYCTSSRSICQLLEYSNQAKGVYFKKCLNINPLSVYSQPECPDLGAAEKKVKIDIRDSIPRGTYYLQNRETSASFPTVCIYCKSGSGSCG